MTERWRKKLGDLDATGPNDDVLARAHQGPTQPDPQIDLPSTSTKVITGVAAFLVFALAISVFAIPALRMRDGGPTGPGEQLLPLWPVRSFDDLEALQARADAGDADAVWATQAGPTVQRFAEDVLGWRASTFELTIPDLVSQPPSGSGTGDPSGSPSATGPIAFPIEALLTYRGTNYSGVCDGLFCPQRIHVVLYQPLGAGEDSVWAVREVHTETTSMGQPGGHLADGDSIFVGTRLFRGEVPTLAYHVGPGSCDVDYASSEWTEVEGSGQMGIEMGMGAGLVLPVQHGCAEPTPGYVWLATADASLIADDESAHVADPFAGGGVPLSSLTAVPVTFVPNSPSSPYIDPPTMPPTRFSSTGTAVAVGWTEYVADPTFGWTIDRPVEAKPFNVDDGVKFSLGDGLFVDVLRLSGAPRADDSSFPLDADRLDGPLTGFTFRGDGQAFEVFLASEHGGQVDLSPGQTETLERMVSSIRFHGWESGETRNGWTALAPVYPNSTMEWIGFDGERFIVTNDGDGGRAVLGPIPRCDAAGEPVLGVNEAAVATVTCPDGMAGSWNRSGVAVQGNDPPFQVNLDVAPGVRSWDGWLLMEISAG